VYIKESSNSTKDQEKENSLGTTKMHTQVIGKKTKCMDKEK